MEDYKNGKILELKKEMVKVPAQTDYEINGIDTSRAIYFYRKEKEKFKIIPRGSYTIVDVASNKYLRITDSSLLGETLEFQVCYLFVKTSSSYIDDFPEIVLLQEHYNQLYEDFNNLLQQLQSNNILGDTLKMSYVLPQLNEGQVWVLRQGEMVAEDIFDLDSRIKEAYETFKLLFSKWVDNTEKPRIDAYVDEKLQIANDEINSKTELEKIELEDYTEQKKNELDIYLTGRKPIQYATIAELQASSNLKINDFVEVAGYYTVGDGSGHKRIIAQTDDGSGVLLVNGMWANIIHSGEVNISWFGAKKDFNFENKIGTDISEILTKALMYTNSRTSTPLKIDGAYYLNKTINIENGFLYLIGNSMPSRLFSKESYQNEKPSSYIYVDGNIEAFVLGSKDKLKKSAPKFFVKNIVFQGKAPRFNTELREATLIKYTGWGYPSRPNCFYECQASGFDKVFNFERNGHTNAFLLNIQWNEFSSNNYTIYTPYQTTERIANIGNLRFDNNINEQGSKLRITNLFGSNSISYNLMESQDDLYNIHMEANSNLDIKGNYYEVNGGTWLFAGESNSKINFYDEFRDNNVTATINSDESRGLRIYKPREIKDSILTDYLYLNDSRPNLSLVDNGSIKTKSSPNLSTYYSKDVFVPFKASRIQNPDLKSSEIIGFSIGSGGYTTNSKGSFMLGCDINGNLWYRFRKESADSDWIPLNTQKQMGVIYDNNFPSDVNGDGGNLIHHPSNKPVFKIKNIWRYADGTPVPVTASELQTYDVVKLNTPYHVEKMKSEGIYNDFIQYMDEKTAYDNQQREKEKSMQLAYEEALKENPNLTYEEFISNKPTTFSRRKRSLEIQEPVPSQALLEFKERYLG